MFCPKCGVAVADGARFCPKCGTPFSTRGAADGGTPNVPYTPAAGTPALGVPASGGYAPGTYGNNPDVPRTPPYGMPASGTPASSGYVPVVPPRKSRWPVMLAAVVAAFVVVVGAGLFVVMPAVAGPTYVNPLDFSDDAQVRRQFNSIMEAFKNFDVHNPSDEVLDFMDPNDEYWWAYSYAFDKLEDQGIDVQRLWDMLVSKLTYSIERVDLSGDRATLQVTIRIPDVGNYDLSSLLSDETYGLNVDEYFNRVEQALDDPSFPMAEFSGNAYYVKRNGEWVMANEDWIPLTDLASSY